MRRLLPGFCMGLLIVGYGLFFTAQGSHAQFDRPNNLVGVHQISASKKDIRDGCRMVNANGGAWGWQTIVIREGEYTVQQLQEVEDIFREEKCIPIYRLASGFGDNGSWARPTEKTIKYFADLFSQIEPKGEAQNTTVFKSATKYTHVIWLNETNHGAEFGGSCDPVAYGQSAVAAAKALKEKNSNIVFMLAGLDLAAPESRPAFCDAGRFYQDMISGVPQVVDYWDALASHCYPLNFTGSPTTNGRRSIMCYRWEKEFLQSIGVKKAADFKAFITETGWKHGIEGVPIGYAAESVRLALNRWQEAGDVEAVTYFAYKFLTPPFDSFSLVNQENMGNEVAFAISGSPKIEGDPEHIHKATCTSTFPKDVVENVPFEITIECTNEGTDIWNGLNDDYGLLLQSPFTYTCSDFHMVKPRNVLSTTCTINPGKTSGCPTLNVGLTRRGSLLMSMMRTEVCTYPAPKMTLTNMRRFPGTPIADGVAEVQIIKEDTETFITQAQTLIQNGMAELPKVEGVNFDDSYRVVVLRPGSLPVQIINVHFGKTQNSFEVPVFLPIDRNEDGKFSLSDLISSYSGN